MPGNVAKALAPLSVTDESGRAVTLGGLWSDRPAVLIFVRQFG